MDREHTDIVIAGGGIAGLCAAAGFGAAGFKVLLVTPEAQPGGLPDTADLRSTAYLQPAQEFLISLGIWPALAPLATPLEVLQIIDSTGTPAVERGRRAFEAAELSAGPFGWNIRNSDMRAALLSTLQTMDNVTLRGGTGFAGQTPRDASTIVRLTRGPQVWAKLLVGADGRESAVRRSAGIETWQARYGQKALAFAVTHALAHNNTSSEIYNQGGPFTTVPLPDQNGAPASAIVWMNPGEVAQDVAAMTDAAFNAAITARSCQVLGEMRAITKRQPWPVISQRARALTAQRMALIAEAAHVLPPIGAQGLNTSLADIAALITAASAHPEDPGNPKALSAYASARSTDITARVTAIDLYNRLTASGAPLLQQARLQGLRALHGLPALRRQVMKAGLGTG